MFNPEMEDYQNAIACDDRRDEMKIRSQIPNDLKDKPWAWNMYFLLKQKEHELVHVERLHHYILCLDTQVYARTQREASASCLTDTPRSAYTHTPKPNSDSEVFMNTKRLKNDLEINVLRNPATGEVMMIRGPVPEWMNPQSLGTATVSHVDRKTNTIWFSTPISSELQ